MQPEGLVAAETGLGVYTGGRGGVQGGALCDGPDNIWMRTTRWPLRRGRPCLGVPSPVGNEECPLPNRQAVGARLGSWPSSPARVPGSWWG